MNIKQNNWLVINKTIIDDLWIYYNDNLCQLSGSIEIPFEQQVYTDVNEGYPVHVYFALKFEDHIRKAILDYHASCVFNDENSVFTYYF